MPPPLRLRERMPSLWELFPRINLTTAESTEVDNLVQPQLQGPELLNRLAYINE